MRVKFGNKIYLALKITHREGSNLMIIATNNGVYTVDTGTGEIADKEFENALIRGYIDVSEHEYSN